MVRRVTLALSVLMTVCLGAALSVSTGEARHARSSSTAGWSRGADMPATRFYLAAVAGPDGKVYAIGGENGAGKPTRTVQAYDVHTGVWTRRAPMLVASQGPRAATVGGKIYVFGAGGTVEAYDPTRNTWRIVASMPTGLTALDVAAGPGSEIYVIGLPDPTDLEVFNTRTRRWTRRAGKPREQFGGAVASGPDRRLYDAAGSTSRLNLVVSIEVYDPGTNRWSYRAPIPTPRYGPAAANGPDGSIHVVGGLVAGSPVGTMEAYDPRKNRWVTEPPMPSPRQDLAAVWGPDGKLYAIGGRLTGYQSSVEVYTP